MPRRACQEGERSLPDQGCLRTRAGCLMRPAVAFAASYVARGLRQRAADASSKGGGGWERKGRIDSMSTACVWAAAWTVCLLALVMQPAT